MFRAPNSFFGQNMTLANLQSQTRLQKSSCSVLDLSSDDEEPSSQRVEKRVEKRAKRETSPKNDEADNVSDDGWENDSFLNDLLENDAESQLVSGIFST